jgi:hypothetical protein
VTRHLRIALLILAGTIAVSTAALGSDSLSGAYKTPTSHLAIFTNGKALLVDYSSVFGNMAHLCECLIGPAFPWKESPQRGMTRYMARWAENHVLYIDVTQETLHLHGNLRQCCGRGWHSDTFPRTSQRRPTTCRVKALNASLYYPTSHAGGMTPSATALYRDLQLNILPTFHSALTSGWHLARIDTKARALGYVKKRDITCRGKSTSGPGHRQR